MEYNERSIDIDKKYQLPVKLSLKSIDGKHLIISIETSNWILLHNDIQLAIFDMLKSKTIGEVLEYIEERNLEQDDLIHVLTELEAKDFENTLVTLPNSKGMCIYLTNECNMSCTHCYMYAGTKAKDELNTAEIIGLLSEFKSHEGENVTFTGGEVTMRADLIEILSYSKKCGFTNTILTNGIGWNDELIEKASEFIDELQISIDGYDEESNSKIRGNGSFLRALSSVNAFCKKNIKVSVVITPSFQEIKSNEDRYVEFAKELIYKYRDNDFYIRFSYELLEGREVKPSVEENLKYTECIEKIVDQCYPGSKHEKFVKNHEKNTILDNCGYGGITIAADGTVFFCNRIYELQSYGNIRNIGFGEIYKLSQEASRLSNVNNLQPCSACDIKYICGGGCRIAYFAELVKANDLFGKHIFMPRKCNNENKESFYRLMIETNELFYI